jgi:hypothetical protein
MKCSPWWRGDAGRNEFVRGHAFEGGYGKEVQVIAGGKAIVAIKTWEIRSRAIRKLDRKPKAEVRPKAKKKAA